MFYADTVGLPTVLARVKEYRERFGDYWQPAPLLEQARRRGPRLSLVKAVVCRQFGPPESLTIEDMPSPRPGPGQVVVSVRAASLNFPDVLVIQNKYQLKPPLPFSPGASWPAW